VVESSKAILQVSIAVF